MLHRYSQVLNLPVICADNGKKAGIVKDILFGLDGKKAEALLLEHKGLSLNRKVVIFSDLLSLGNDAAIVNGNDSIADMNRRAYAKAFPDAGRLMGLKVYSREGGDLGIVRDVIFDYPSGRIEELEISDGFLQDVMKGRKLLPLFGRVEMGEEYALVEKEAVEEMEGTGGGISNRLINKEPEKDGSPTAADWPKPSRDHIG